MSRSNKPDELFQELKNVERSSQARTDTLARLQRRIAHRKRCHFVPVFMTGILVLAGMLLLTLTLMDNGYPETGTMGGEGEEQQVIAENEDEKVTKLEFKGAGDEWNAEYEVVQRRENGQHKESWRYILTYMGYEMPEEIDFEIRNSQGDSIFGEDNKVSLDGTVTGSGSCTCDPTQEDGAINVTITWDGQTTNFDLTPHYVDPLPLTGTGENWSFEYMPDDFGDDDRAVLTYIGEGEPPQEFNYQIGEGGTSGNGIWLTDGQYIVGGGCGACEAFQETDEVEITVEWDGKTESFTAFAQ